MNVHETNMIINAKDVYTALHNRLDESADAIRDYAQLYLNGEIRERDLIAHVNICLNDFDDTYDMYEEVSKVFEKIGQMLKTDEL